MESVSFTIPVRRITHAPACFAMSGERKRRGSTLEIGLALGFVFAGNIGNRNRISFIKTSALKSISTRI